MNPWFLTLAMLVLTLLFWDELFGGGDGPSPNCPATVEAYNA